MLHKSRTREMNALTYMHHNKLWIHMISNKGDVAKYDSLDNIVDVAN